MNQWITLFQKEQLEMIRNFKWIWVPMVFILLGVQEPLTLYYMPKILDLVGGLPEGAIFQMPVPTAGEVLAASLGQYNTLGILIIALTSMGIIAGERKSGVAGLILVKPISYTSFITAKWAGAMLLLWVSYFIGYVASWYYVVILFENIPFADFIQSYVVNGIWLSFVLSVSVFFNSLFRSPGIVGFITMASVIVLSLISSTFIKWLEWSPSLLSSYTTTFIMTQYFPKETLPSAIVSLVGMVALLAGSITILRKKELV